MWQDALAGLFGGLGGGMQTIQRQRQQEVENQLRQRQQQMQEEQQKRQAVEAARKMLNPGSAVNLDQLSQFKEYGLDAGIVKGPDGNPMVEIDPLTQQRLTNAQLETEDLTTRVADGKIDLQTKQQIMSDPAGFYKKPIGERMVMGQIGGLKSATLPEEDVRLRVAEIQAQARAQAAAYQAQLGASRLGTQQDNAQSANLARALQAINEQVKLRFPGGFVPPTPEAQAQVQAITQKYLSMFGVSPETAIPGGPSPSKGRVLSITPVQ